MEMYEDWEGGNWVHTSCRLGLAKIGVMISLHFQCSSFPTFVGMASQAGQSNLGLVSFPAIHTGEGQQMRAGGV